MVKLTFKDCNYSISDINNFVLVFAFVMFHTESLALYTGGFLKLKLVSFYYLVSLRQSSPTR